MSVLEDHGYTLEDVEYGIDGGALGIYDGVIIWKMKDGTLLNRWEGVEGCGRRASLTAGFIREMEIADGARFMAEQDSERERELTSESDND